MPKLLHAVVKTGLFLLCFSGATEAMDSLYEPKMRIALWPERQLRDDPMHYASRKNGITRITQETRPSLEVFPAKNPNSVAVLIFPGGGFAALAYDLEGTEIAHWLNDIGLTAIIVRYTVPGKSSAPFRDGQRAMRVVRKNAGDWGLKPEKIGAMGFSAGAYVVARLSTHWNEATYDRIDDADDLSTRPDFAALIYPAYLDRKKSKNLRKEVEVNVQTPPTFIVHTMDDSKYVSGSIRYNDALESIGTEVEFQLYNSGGHGFGIRLSPESEVSGWTGKFQDWLSNSTD